MILIRLILIWLILLLNFLVWRVGVELQTSSAWGSKLLKKMILAGWLLTERTLVGTAGFRQLTSVFIRIRIYDGRGGWWALSIFISSADLAICWGHSFTFFLFGFGWCVSLVRMPSILLIILHNSLVQLNPQLFEAQYKCYNDNDYGGNSVL